MDDFFNKFADEISIIITGAIAGLIRGLDTYRGSTFRRRVQYFICGLVASVFFCWLFYEFAFYLTSSPRFSLACGGFASWQGAEWIKKVVEKFINSKLDENGKEQDEI